jgi:toxin FitB
MHQPTTAVVAGLLRSVVMSELPQKELRNRISHVLRAAERGAEYTITVGGRPVAHLGPHRPRQWRARDDVQQLLATPTDPSLRGRPRPRRRGWARPGPRAVDMRGLLDTSVAIARTVDHLPDEAAVSAATIGELHFGVHLAPDTAARHARLRRLAEIEAAFDPLPIDAAIARSYGMLAHVVLEAGRPPRRSSTNLLVAATAHVHEVPLYTKDPGDLAGLEGHVEVRVV